MKMCSGYLSGFLSSHDAVVPLRDSGVLGGDDAWVWLCVIDGGESGYGVGDLVACRVTGIEFFYCDGDSLSCRVIHVSQVFGYVSACDVVDSGASVVDGTG